MKRIFAIVGLAVFGSSAAMADGPQSLAEAIFALGEAVCPEVAETERADCLGEAARLATRALKLETRQMEIWSAVVDGDQKTAAAVKTEIILGIGDVRRDVESFADKYAAEE